MKPGIGSVALMAAVGVSLVLRGCTSANDYSARFVRYTSLQDGQRVAVVQPVDYLSPGGEVAYSRFEDLRPGELVSVRFVGRSWDVPQWKPEREIVTRR
jgi:hypothetical protein